MSTIVTRAGKGSALTHTEVDANFTNLNTDKIEAAQTVTLTNKTISGANNTLSNIANGSLTNSSVTIGSTSVSLGGTAATVAGLTLTSPTVNTPTVSGGTINNAVIGGTTAAAGTFTSLTDSGNLAFTGTGNRITGDFSNATPVNRVALQTSTANGNTTIEVLPNGTGTNAGIAFESDSAATNGANLQAVLVGASDARFVSGIRGTGTYLPMTFYTGGSERMRVDTSGNVGIGLSNTSGYRLAVKSGAKTMFVTTDASSAYSYADGNYYLGATGADNVVAVTNNIERMRIDTSGNVGIGTTSPTKRLDVVGQFRTSGAAASGYALIEYGTSATGTNNWHVGSEGDGTFRWYNGNFGAGTERARITSDGNLLVGTTSQIGLVTARAVFSNTSNLLVLQAGNGNVGAYMTNNSGTGNWVPFSFCNNGSSFTQIGSITTTASATAYNTSSDYRLKENVQPMSGALARVAALKPVTYKWKIDGSDSEGFIAHELAEVCPQAVTGEKDAVNEDGSIKPQGIDTSFLVATLTAAIQELKAELDATKAEVALLKGAA